MKTLTPLCLLAAALACPAADVDDLQAAQKAYAAAFRARDGAAIAGMLDSGYFDFAIDSDSPADWGGRSPAERKRYFDELLGKYETWNVSLAELKVRAAGDTGIVTGVERVQRQPKGGVQENLRWRFTATWLKNGGSWRLAAMHRSVMPPFPPPGPPLSSDAAEKRILDTALGTPRYANVPLPDARALRVIAELVGAKNAVEFGTSTGYSGMWLANALRKTGGKLTTFELDPGRAATARERFKQAGVDGIVTVVVGDGHENLKQVKGPLDLVFIDAEKPGYPDYLKKMLPLVRPGGVILAHNVKWPAPEPEFIRAITTNPDLETIFIDMDDQGLSISLKKR